MGEFSFTSPDGHQVHVGNSPQGVHVVVIPATPPFEDGVMDVFQLGLLHSSAARVASAIEEGQPYVTRDGAAGVVVGVHSSVLEFRSKHVPGMKFLCDLGANGTQEFLTFLRATLEGDTAAVARGNVLYSGQQKIGRNEPCPCGSGKKYKKCHLGREFALPIELHPYLDSDDPYITPYIDSARADPRLLHDSEFWNGLASSLGTAGQLDEAIKVFEKALSIFRSPAYLLNYAATLGASERHDEALQVLDEVPAGYARKAVISANILQDMGVHEEAIGLYEEAIEEEPGFFLPYARILNSLRAIDSPLYEHWLNRGVQAVPESPAIAIAYCYFLKGTMRLEELANADWIDSLSAETGRLDMIGRNSDDPRSIIEAQLIRAAALVAVSQQQRDLEDAVAILASANRAWHFCDPAKLLVATAANLGRPDLIDGPYERICPDCRRDGVGIPRHLESIRARAFVTCEKYTDAVRCCKAALEAVPDCKLTLWDYWWALDELGHGEQAVEAAETLYRLAPETSGLAYNLGFLCGKVGRFGRARHYYESQLAAQSEHLLAVENVTFVYMLEGNLDQARKSWRRLCDGYRRHCPEESSFPFEAEDGSEVWMSVEEFLAWKGEKFERLMVTAEESLGSLSYSLDLVAMNNEGGPCIGSNTTIGRASYSFEDLLTGAGSHSPEKKADIDFHFRAEARDDYSAIIATLLEVVPCFPELPAAAQRSLIEAQRRLATKHGADFAPVVVAFAKAVEVSLKVLVFDAFRASFMAQFDAQKHLEAAKDYKKYDRVERFCRFLADGFHLELGSMALALELTTGKTAARLAVLGELRQYLTETGRGVLADRELLGVIRRLSSDYRNPAAHSKVFGFADAETVRELALGVLSKF